MATLATRIADLITAIGTDIKQHTTWITGSSSGNLTGLSTTAKTSLIAAINEVNAAAAAATVPDATTGVKGKVALASNAEVLAGVEATKALTSASLQSMANIANGWVKLDGTAKVPAAQLPSYVDDVLEYANFAALPVTGAAGVLYVTLNDNKEFRWGGSAYVALVASPGSTDNVPEGSVNLYFTNSRADARADARITAQIGNPDVDLAAAYATAKA